MEITESKNRNETQFRKKRAKQNWQGMEQAYEAFPEHERKGKGSKNTKRI